MGHLTRSGDDANYVPVSVLGESSLAITLDDTGTKGLGLQAVTLSGTTSVSIASSGVGGGGFTKLSQLDEKDNVLTTVTITGSEAFRFGSPTTDANSGDGVVTESAATATAPTTIQSSLTLIDASATTGGVTIFAGATNKADEGEFQNDRSINADVTITYTGLEIKGGLGTDYIENDAKDGIVIDGNGNGDIVILGGGHGMATVGTGTGDIVEVGNSALGSAGDPATAVNDTVKFGSASTATLDVYGGAEAGSTASTTNIGLTKVLDAAAGLNMYFWNLFSHTSIIADETAAVASAKNLTAAENHAVAALDGPGVAYFTYKGNEYFVATDFAETKVSASCEVVKLVGVTDLTATNSAGVVTLHHVG